MQGTAPQRDSAAIGPSVLEIVDAFPRLLVATEFPPNASGGGPAVVRQMLKEWPAERLFWWSCLPETDSRFGRAVAAHRVKPIPPRLYPHFRLCRLKSWLLDRLWVPAAARSLRKALRELRPDAVWVIPHIWSIPPIGRVLSGGEFRFHISIHDYVDINSGIARLGAGRAARMARTVERLYRAADTRDVICESMQSDMRRRTGCDGAIVHAGIEPEDLAYLERKESVPVAEIRIAYAGTIIVEKEFALFVQALEAIRPQLPRPVFLDFFGSHRYAGRPWFNASWMREHGNLPERELLDRLRQCTWGFSPMSLTDEDPRYNRYSFPTKLISYLAAGLPVIGLGHPESTIIRAVEQNGIGLSLTTSDPSALSGQLRAGLLEADDNPWRRYQSQLLRYSRSEFDADQMRLVLWRCFSSAA